MKFYDYYRSISKNTYQKTKIEKSSVTFLMKYFQVYCIASVLKLLDQLVKFWLAGGIATVCSLGWLSVYHISG